jgi:hypothetical protein
LLFCMSNALRYCTACLPLGCLQERHVVAMGSRSTVPQTSTVAGPRHGDKTRSSREPITMVGPCKKMEISKKYGIPDSFNVTQRNFRFFLCVVVSKNVLFLSKVFVLTC